MLFAPMSRNAAYGRASERLRQLRGHMKSVLRTGLFLCALVTLNACGGSASQPPPNESNPTPSVISISPNSAAAGGAAFTLTVNGTNFSASSTVNFGGAVATTFVNSTQLTAAIPA